MRKGTGIAGATLLFDQRNGPPDLVLVMQYLIDDLRGEGRRIAAIKLTPSTLRLRADPFELLLTVAQGPIAASSLQGLLRPPVGDRPDFARVHLARSLRLHQHAMGFLVRRRGAPIPDLDEAMRSLAREGQFALSPVLEAVQPALLIWQPGGLVLTPDEFLAADARFLLTPGDPERPLAAPPSERLSLPRPELGFTSQRSATAAGRRQAEAEMMLVPEADDSPAGFPPGSFAEVYAETPADPRGSSDALSHTAPVVRQDSRLTRHDKRSLGRLFGTTPDRPPVLARLDRASDRLNQALREPGAEDRRPEDRRRAEPGRRAALWAALLPFVGMTGA